MKSNEAILKEVLGLKDDITYSDHGLFITVKQCLQAMQEAREGQTPSIIVMEQERFVWALKTFPKATAQSSLNKLEEEIKEVRKELELLGVNNGDLHEEYADCLMCLFDSAGRAGITPQEIFYAFKLKLEKNKNRDWKVNVDNTYSHVKPTPPETKK